MRIRTRDQTAKRKQIGMFLAARADFRRHSRDHQSPISVYWPQYDEFTVTHVDRTYETEINAVPGDVLRTLCELPNTAFSPDMTRLIKPQVEE